MVVHEVERSCRAGEKREPRTRRQPPDDERAGREDHRVSQGEDYRHPFAADVIERRWEEHRCAKLRWTRKERQATWETPPRSPRWERTEA